MGYTMSKQSEEEEVAESTYTKREIFSTKVPL